ncbi:Rha family transcriptional regulator [Pseudomonas sp. TUM22785]|uniref:Rha family transcriptional regulator n=1 Tax=Pseudomonas sp. TUM22785 TaxID=3019098 RepID=UPI00230626C9|nr:Rha family transcriptional regulator [Pseudomonas sp. TUM22785]WCD79145.1 Rha family transcriptional regulator [Pseudomonas sp. TUM22785]
MSIVVQQQLTMSSREIAGLTGKAHYHVKRDIESMLEELKEDASKFGCIYLDSRNREQTEYLLDRDHVECLLAGYSAPLRMKVIRRLHELEDVAGQRLPIERKLPTTADSFNAGLIIAKALGLEGNQAVLSANRMVSATLGVDVMQMAGVPYLVNESQELTFTPTDIGDKFDGLSGQAVNKVLERCGLQRSFEYRKGRKRWEVLPEGRQFAVVVDTAKKHSDGAPVQQIRWKESTLDRIEPFIRA